MPGITPTKTEQQKGASPKEGALSEHQTEKAAQPSA